MAKLPSLTIKATFILISAGMVAAIAMVAVAVVLNSQSEEELARSLQTKYDSYCSPTNSAKAPTTSRDLPEHLL
jgi:hypothetical protein